MLFWGLAKQVWIWPWPKDSRASTSQSYYPRNTPLSLMWQDSCLKDRSVTKLFCFFFVFLSCLQSLLLWCLWLILWYLQLLLWWLHLLLPCLQLLRSYLQLLLWCLWNLGSTKLQSPIWKCCTIDSSRMWWSWECSQILSSHWFKLLALLLLLLFSCFGCKPCCYVVSNFWWFCVFVDWLVVF